MMIGSVPILFLIGRLLSPVASRQVIIVASRTVAVLFITLLLLSLLIEGTTVNIYEFDGNRWTNHSSRYIVRHIGAVPEYFHTSWVHIDRLAFGEISSGHLFILYQANNIAREHGDMMELDVLDGPNLNVANSGGNLDSAGHSVEPGSFFYSISPIHSNGLNASLVPLKNEGYIEFVMRKTDILKHRRFTVPQPLGNDASTVIAIDVPASGDVTSVDLLGDILSDKRRSRKERYKRTLPSSASGIKDVSGGEKVNDDPIHICIWGSNKLDGQKSIWINQVQHLTKHSSSTAYNFTWILTSNSSGVGTLKVLSELTSPPQIISSPFENFGINKEDLFQSPGDGTPPFFELWDGSAERITEYILQRLAVTRNGVFEETTPKWVNQFLVGTREKIRSINCGIMVYGSNRGFSNDALIVIMGAALNIPTVSELLNLFADPDNLPNAIIGPSHYAVYHESIAPLLPPESGVRVEVISPGIDIDRFDVNLRLQPAGQKWRHPRCPNISASRKEASDCIVLGFMARISIVKNPGLFVMSAREIHHRHQNTRFVMIGDGPLLPNIKEIVHMIGLTDVFYFPGWLIGPDLPKVLAGIDIMLNPSLRAWSETFCIANIEAMAMGIPLVTFAVGGVGEYVSPPQRCLVEGKSDIPVSPDWTSYACDVNGSSSNVPDFEIVNNALILNVASPETILEAVSYLIFNSDERKRIGMMGHETVVKYFNADRQMKQYSAMYKSVHDNFYAKNTYKKV